MSLSEKHVATFSPNDGDTGWTKVTLGGVVEIVMCLDDDGRLNIGVGSGQVICPVIFEVDGARVFEGVPRSSDVTSYAMFTGSRKAVCRKA